jgi:serine/threonine protein kinase
MAPEYLNRGIITKKLDIFSLGVIIIEIVTGHKDYPDETDTSSQEFIELVRKICFYFQGGAVLSNRCCYILSVA